MQVFVGNTADSGTVGPQLDTLRKRFGLQHVTLFDQRDLVEISSPDYPGERLLLCRSPDLAHERAHKSGG